MLLLVHLLAVLPFALTAALPPPNLDPVLVNFLTTAPTRVQRIKTLADSDFVFDFNAPAKGVTTGLDGESRAR